MTATELLKKHKGNQTAAAKEAGVARSTFAARLKKEVTSDKAPKAVAKNIRTLQEFKQTFDKDTIVPAKIKAALKDVGSGWLYESEFVKEAGVSYSDLGIYRDMFTDHVVTLKRENKRAWAGTVAVANQMKALI